MRNLLTSHSEQTASDGWMLKLACLKNKHCLIIKAKSEAYIQWCVLDVLTLSSSLNIIFGDTIAPFSQEKTLQMTQGHLCKFHLLLLCLYNGFLSTVKEPQVPPTHTPQIFLPSLFLLFLLPRPSRTNALTTYAEQNARAGVRTSHPPTGDLKTDTLMTLHLNQSSFPTSDLGGAAIVAAPCNIQSQTKGEINDLSECQCAGGWFTNTRHMVGRRELRLLMWSHAAAWI